MHPPVDFDLPVTVAGVTFRNPFYVASGPTTMTIEQLERIRDTGWGGASLKLTVHPLPYINRVPRYGYYPDEGLLTFTAEKRLLLDELLRLIEQGKKRAPELVLFANITYAGEDGPDGWAHMARQCESAGVDIIELNLCCPNMSFNVEVSGTDTGGPKTGASMGSRQDVATVVVTAVADTLTIPLFVKLTPEGGKIAGVAKALFEAGADAVGGTANRLGVPPIDLENPTTSMYLLQKEVGMGCLSGPWLKPLAQRDVYEIRKLVGPDRVITAAGGVAQWRDAIEMAMVGADLVGICAATIINGFGFMPEFIAGVKTYLARKGHSCLADVRDLLVSEITSAPKLTIFDGHARMCPVRATAPCTYACPNSVPAQGYIRRVADGDFEDAYQLIMAKSPLQQICGRICDHPCEAACTRAEKDDPVAIRAIKEFVLDMAQQREWKPDVAMREGDALRSRVAVIGSGPAGIAAAYDLARAGHGVVMFEAAPEAGGMLRYGIPSFRLDPTELDRELNVLFELGVELQIGKSLGRDITIDSLKESGYDAIFLGTGCQTGSIPRIPGHDASGCLTALDLLRAVSLGEAPTLGKRVAVIGGGFTTIDSARTALRLGGQEVFVLYRRTRDEMPATGDEIREAEEEGVKIMYLVSPQEVRLQDGCVTSIRMLNHVLGQTDDSGRRRPLDVPGTEFDLRVDSVIFALGQTSESAGVDVSADGFITVDDATCATAIAGVYAGGDCATGPENVIGAIAMGKRAAASIDKALMGDQAFLEYPDLEAIADKEAVLQRHGKEPRIRRVAQEATTPAERCKTFNPYRKVLSEAQAVQEAQRCLACGCGAGCQTCHDICKMFAFRIEPGGRIELNEDACVACGMCIHRCPNGVIEMVRTSS